MSPTDTPIEATDENRGRSDTSSISAVGIMTADRTVLLERALSSYIQNNRQRRTTEYIIYDDSKDIAASAANFAVAQKLARRFDLPIRFAGPKEREGYAREMVASTAIAAEILEYALLNRQGYTLGQNRNALLLDSVGSMIWCADDDTLGTPVQHPEATQTALRCSSGGDPAEFWCYSSTSEAQALISVKAPLAVLDAHEQLLGKSISELIERGPLVDNRGDRASEDLLRRSERRDSVVRITFNGLIGDCAWGSPFGLWHEPMGYLALADASLERLTRTEDFYQQALQSRQLLRVTAAPCLADASFSMLTFCGLDNRELLPPNLPTHRGQDLIFGQMLWSCFRDSIFGHLPFALVHDPLPPRKFWPGEITRSASGVDLCRLMIETMKLLPDQEPRATADERLSKLGTHLAQLAKLPARALREQFMDSLRASNQRFKLSVMARGAAQMIRAPYYANDVRRFFDKQKQAEHHEYYWVPLDLCGVDGFAAAESRLRRALEQFGALLQHWPSMVRAARALRKSGVRLSAAV